MKARTALRIAFGVLFVSFALNLGTGSLGGMSLSLSFILLIVTVLTGVAFDIVGTAVAAAAEPPLHAVAARRIKGGVEALRLVRNAPQVANFCNDIVGDICGTLSGALAAASASGLASKTGANEVLLLASVVAVAASSTIALKFISKSFAIEEADKVILVAGKMIAYAKDIIPGIPGRRARSGGRKDA